MEFAIVLPLLVLILFGILDFALLFYNKQVLTNASREGARAAIVVDNRTTPTTIDGDELTFLQDIIKNYCKDRLINLNGNDDLVNAPVFSINTGTGHITATVTYDYDHLFSGITGFSSTTLTGRTVMRSE
ncbi:MAG: TadE/TadG family type IV pilus assembly protein [Desulfotignum sp.]|nr:TadE/TadG family type IV pilus assembly protein [Desulfotignum sp.]